MVRHSRGVTILKLLRLAVLSSRLQHLNLGELEGRANLAHTHLSHLVTDLDTFIERLSKSMSGKETSSKCVSSSVRVNDLVIGELADSIRFRVGILGVEVALALRWRGRCDQCRIGSLRDHSKSRARGIRLR
jgi:hypothetical protein